MPLWGYGVLGVICMIVGVVGLLILRASKWLGEDDEDKEAPRSAFFN